MIGILFVLITVKMIKDYSEVEPLIREVNNDSIEDDDSISNNPF